MPSGELNLPLSPPYCPNTARKVPLLENMCILSVSATYTLPDDASTVIPEGADNLDTPSPDWFHLGIPEDP
jgi:hypothetical protein